VKESFLNAKDRIICAIDVESTAVAVERVTQLKDHVGVFKVGLELLTSEGVGAVHTLRNAGADRIFYDGKLHDIPNTVAGAMRGVVRLGAWCVTVHATGGKAMLQAAVKTAHEVSTQENVPRPRVFAVTVLTSIGAEVLSQELQVGKCVTDYVAHLAQIAEEAGCDGVIASPHEIETIRNAVKTPNFLIVTPGVRPAGADKGDQARVMTPAEAIRRGADYLVIGRPILAAPDPTSAAQAIAAEIGQALG
jgi:orotidine-5'-phosphate decarboxylase